MADAPSQAVFLSYASQDAEAVQRIAEALRTAGVEVWFDRNELVGGDAWDAKIRGQIASCALFVPVISAATQARREGYFRLEWKLAAQRTHAMADGTPFLLPVVIDETKDGEALVPAEFRAVQWIRLRPGGFGATSPVVGSGTTSPGEWDGKALAAFCSRVGKLLGREGGAVTDSRSDVGARLDVWTEDKGNSQTGDMGNTLGKDAVMVLVFGWASGREAPDAGSVRFERGEVEQPKGEEAEVSFPLPVGLRARPQADGQ